VRWGYPATLVADAALGLVCLALLPLTLAKKGQSVCELVARATA
jgi:hypothetical protein